MKRCIVLILILLFCFGCTQREVTEYADPEKTPEKTAVQEATESSAHEAEGTSANAQTEEIVVTVDTPVPVTNSPLPTLPPTPTPTPSPEPTPEPTPTPTPEPTKDPNRKMVALTFDDGPNLTLTIPVLEKLEQYHVKATFFLLASAINDTSGPMLQMMIDGGHEIGVHGLTHERMTNFSASKNTKRLNSAAAEISGWIEGGYQPVVMRPPGGNRDGKVTLGAKNAGMAVILWDVDTLDWKTQNVEKIMDVVKKRTKNGSIILCHDHHKPTLDSLDVMIPWLLEQGYELVTVSELLNSQPGGMVPGTVYKCKNTGD